LPVSLKFCPCSCCVFAGIIAFALFRDATENSYYAYPTLGPNLLPVGTCRLVIAAFAAVMGAMILFSIHLPRSSPSIFTEATPASFRETAREFWPLATGMMVGLLGLLWVPFHPLHQQPSLHLLQRVHAYISPPLPLAFILGILWPGSWIGRHCSLLTGFGMGATRCVPGESLIAPARPPRLYSSVRGAG